MKMTRDTRQRILDAALQVFAQEGVSGATTREIARVASVNEVTLFRYFKSKNELLRQVVLQSSRDYEQIFADAKMDSLEEFRDTIRNYAQAYRVKVCHNEDFIRTFMGEMKRHLKLSRRLFDESSKAGRQKFIEYLEAAKEAGFIRRDLDTTTAADALTGMLMAGLLRRPMTDSLYRYEVYVETSIQLFLKGIDV